MKKGIPCTWMRGGTSKGAYFLARDLPAAEAERDALLLSVMGSPDPRQIDGIGGADPLTSKVAVVSASQRPGADIDYLFLQVFVDRAIVTDRQNCGNILSGVVQFAVEKGLIEASDGRTEVAVYMVNSDQVAGGDHRDARRCGDVRGERRNRRRSRHRAAGASELPAGGGLDLRRPAPHGKRRGRDRRHRAHLHRQRHAGGADAGFGPGHRRLREPRRPRRERGAEGAAGVDSIAGGVADESGRREGKVRAEDDACRPRPALAAPSRRARSSRTAAMRRSACSVRSASPPPACSRARPPALLRKCRTATRSWYPWSTRRARPA